MKIFQYQITLPEKRRGFHLKASLLGSSILIPISNGKFNLGIWQGIYLCEHRDRGGPRDLVITIWGE